MNTVQRVSFIIIYFQYYLGSNEKEKFCSCPAHTIFFSSVFGSWLVESTDMKLAGTERADHIENLITVSVYLMEVIFIGK